VFARSVITWYSQPAPIEIRILSCVAVVCGGTLAIGCWPSRPAEFRVGLIGHVGAMGTGGSAPSATWAASQATAASALGGFGGGMASSETNSVRDFLTSLDAVMEANAKLDLVGLWQRPEADFLARLWYKEPELLARFYGRMVTVSMDPTTSVTTLRVPPNARCKSLSTSSPPRIATPSVLT
jgi:hypothetical protein